MYNSPYLKQRSMQDPMPIGYEKPSLGVEMQKQEPMSFTPEMPVQKSAAPMPQGGAPIDAGQVGTSALSGAAVGGPVGAAVGAAGSLLSQYIAQKAADERAKREGISQAYAKQASDEQNIINSIMATNARALR